MEEQRIIDHIIGLKQDVGSLNAKVDNMYDEIKLIRRYEKRLGRVESEVRNAKRLFSGLFSILLVAGATAVSWLKGS